MLAEAGGRAERRESLREAHRYYTRALDVLGDEHAELRVELRVRRADMAMQLGQLKEATDELLEVAEARRRGWAVPTSKRRHCSCSATSTSARGGQTDAHRRLLEAEGLAASTGDARLQARGWRSSSNTFVGDYLGTSSRRRSRTSAPRSPSRRRSSEPRARRRGPPPHRGAAAWATISRPRRPSSGAASSSRTTSVVTGSKPRRTSWLGAVAYYRDRPEEAERLCLQARTWFERTGDSYFQVQNLVLSLGDLRARGRPGRGRREVAARGASHRASDRRLGPPEYVLAPRRGRSWPRTGWTTLARSSPSRLAASLRRIRSSSAWLSTDRGAGSQLRPASRAAAAAAFAEAVRLFEELDYPLDARGSALRAGPLAAARSARWSAAESRARASALDLRPHRRRHPPRRGRRRARGAGRGAGSRRPLNRLTRHAEP